MESSDDLQPSTSDLARSLHSTEPDQDDPHAPADVRDTRARPLRSRDPVEDEEPHGMIIVDQHPEAYFGSVSSTNVEQHTYSSSSGVSSQKDEAKVSIRSPSDEGAFPHGLLQGHDLIHRVESIEARMEVYDRVKDMTMQELLDIQQELARMPKMPKDSGQDALNQKMDQYIEEIAHKNEQLTRENIQLQRLVEAAREQADKERHNPDLEEIERKLEDKLKDLQHQLKIKSEDCDRAVKKKVQAESDKESMCQQRNHWRKRSNESDKHRKTAEDSLAEKSNRLEITEKNLSQIKTRCEEVTKKNVRLKRENSYLKETIFHVVRVGTATAAFDESDRSHDVELECFSCRRTYTPGAKNDCRFHPLPAMHFREWSLWPIGKEHEVDRNKLYWPCCDKLVYNRPDGCSPGRHHQSWEMDIMMKQTLLLKSNLDWD